MKILTTWNKILIYFIIIAFIALGWYACGVPTTPTNWLCCILGHLMLAKLTFDIYKL